MAESRSSPAAANSPPAAAANSPPAAAPRASPAPANPTGGPALVAAAQDVLDDDDSAIGSLEDSTASISDSILEYRQIHGRTYHSDRKEGDNIYWGPNDQQQNELQDILNHCHMLSLDGKLHMAPLPKDFSGKALDIGTGTGIWAIDFADQYPKARVIGTDLSPIQPTYVPPSCEFQIDDATAVWTWDNDSIDYVHMRWMLGCIPDFEKLAHEAFRVLKPGGWIEWYDFDAKFYSDDNSMPPDSALARWNDVFEGGARKLGSTSPWRILSEDLQRKVFDKAGFINFHHYDTKIPVSPWPADEKHKEIGMYALAGWTSDLEGSVTFSATAHGWSREEIIVYCAEARTEFTKCRIHAYYPGRNAWAQKPL